VAGEKQAAQEIKSSDGWRALQTNRRRSRALRLRRTTWRFKEQFSHRSMLLALAKMRK